jgi:hypothetical protein
MRQPANATGNATGEYVSVYDVYLSGHPAAHRCFSEQVALPVSGCVHGRRCGVGDRDAAALM